MLFDALANRQRVIALTGYIHHGFNVVVDRCSPSHAQRFVQLVSSPLRNRDDHRFVQDLRLMPGGSKFSVAAALCFEATSHVFHFVWKTGTKETYKRLSGVGVEHTVRTLTGFGGRGTSWSRAVRHGQIGCPILPHSGGRPSWLRQ